MVDFTGKAVVVTGGGSGIGFGIANEVASRGANVWLLGRSEDKLTDAARQISAGGQGKVGYTSVDVRDGDGVDAALRSAAEQLGTLDALVNNAAGNFVVASEEMSSNAFKAVVDIVLVGSFNCSRSFARIARESKGAVGANRSVLNVIATYAWTGHPGTVHSAASKAGVLAMTRTLAVEWAQYGIRVNAIAPGPTDTEGAAAALWPSDRAREELLDTVPLHRFATVDEVARSAAFLLSDDASYITGEVLTVDGGQWLGKQVFKGQQEGLQ